jgi:hypothetical protein
LIFVLAFAFGGAALFGQTAEEIIERHQKAHGGAEAWSSVQSMTLEGVYTGFSTPGPFELHFRRDGKIRFDHQLGAFFVKQAFDGEDSWWINPWNEGLWPMGYGDAALYVLRQLGRFPTPLFDYQARGWEMTFHGKEEFDGGEYWRFQFDLPTGETEDWYLDPDTYLEAARVSPGANFESLTEEQITWFDEFRQVGDVVIAHHVESEFHTRYRVMTVEKVTLNPQLGDEMFARPELDEMGRLAFLEGQWIVHQARPPRGEDEEPEKFAESSVTFDRQIDGNLIFGVMDEGDERGAGDTLIQFAYDRWRDRYALTLINNQNGGFPQIQTGNWEDGKLSLDTLATDSTFYLFERTFHQKWVLRDIEDGRFMIDAYQSVDAGENWRLRRIMTFERAGDGDAAP